MIVQTAEQHALVEGKFHWFSNIFGTSKSSPRERKLRVNKKSFIRIERCIKRIHFPHIETVAGK
jgi:hypothetical protein